MPYNRFKKSYHQIFNEGICKEPEKRLTKAKFKKLPELLPECMLQSQTLNELKKVEQTEFPKAYC